MNNNYDNLDTSERGFGSIKTPTEDRLGKRKKPSTAKYILTMLGYLAVVVLVIALGTAAYVWVDEAIKKSATETALSTNIADQLGVSTLYSQEQVDEMIAEAVANAVPAGISEEEVNARVLQAGQDMRNEVLGGIKAQLLEGNTMVETLRLYYPDEIVLVSGGEFHFVPINRELKMNDYLQENLEVLEDGEFRFLKDGDVISHRGIDVSSHQGKIDWQAVANDGIEFTFIRSALRGYGSGKLVADENFERNIKGATGAGLHVGVYIFSQAINEQEVTEEAQMVLEQISGYDIDCPVVIDVEKVSSSTGRMNLISLEERTNLVLLFCQIIEDAGYKPMIYFNAEMAALMLDLETLENYEKWFASYNENLFYPYHYRVWQYSSKGKVAGINTDVDLNISFDEFWND